MSAPAQRSVRGAAKALRIHSDPRFLMMHTVVFPICYVAAALKIAADTGYAPWDGEFLLMFAPVVLLGEQILAEIRRRRGFAS